MASLASCLWAGSKGTMDFLTGCDIKEKTMQVKCSNWRLRNSGSWDKTEQQNEEDGEILSWGEQQKCCWEVGQAKLPVGARRWIQACQHINASFIFSIQ